MQAGPGRFHWIMQPLTGTSVFLPHPSPEDLTPHGAAAQLPDPKQGAASHQLKRGERSSPLSSSLNQI